MNAIKSWEWYRFASNCLKDVSNTEIKANIINLRFSFHTATCTNKFYYQNEVLWTEY